ncbi:CBN-TAF-11.3 protein [Caenorhabditis brenneri]|uniref:Transcription initiation factor TFIID subunit 11 n=1 Tax=Caenorhabditis brenneri TaxID=135651 RepID=G0MKU9_CAEBE|nr:CBN-TAF-11.3 protein [Caenorhabditis brenneri]
MSSKDDIEELFGGLSESDSSEANDEWENPNTSNSLRRDLEMSSDEENDPQEESATVEPMEYQYAKIASVASEGNYSSMSSVTTSVSSSSDENVDDVEMDDHEVGFFDSYFSPSKLQIPDNLNNFMEKTLKYSPVSKNVRVEYVLDTTDNVSTQDQLYKTRSLASEDTTPSSSKMFQASTIKAQPPALKKSTSWNQRNTMSGNHPLFNDEEQKAITESTKAEQIISNKLLIGNFSNEQLDRYIAFRRSKFTRQVIKNVISEVTGKPTSDPIAVAIAGLTKLFVGEIVEEAVELRDALNEQNKPVQPQHIKSAFNKLVNEGKLWPPYGKKY